MSELTLFLKPFKNLSDYLRGVFILVQYSEQSISCSTRLINIITKSNFVETEIEILKTKLLAFPDMYGKDFFDESDLKYKIDSLLLLEPIIQFTCEK